jgi:hypothetical protein
MQASNLSRRFFAALASTNAGRRNCKEKKKDDPSLAIGENYINKMFLFRRYQPPKKKVKSPRLSTLFYFLSCFFGDKTNPLSLPAAHSISE